MLNPLSSFRSAPSFGAGDGLAQIELTASRAKAGKELSEKEIQAVGQQFEAILLQQLLTTMRKSMPESGLFGESSADEIYKDMFDQRIAETVAEAGQTGFSQIIVEDILRQQQEQRTELPKESRFLPLTKPEDRFKTIPEGQHFRKIPNQQPGFLPLPNRNPSYLPIKVNQANLNKLDSMA